MPPQPQQPNRRGPHSFTTTGRDPQTSGELGLLHLYERFGLNTLVCAAFGGLALFAGAIVWRGGSAALHEIKVASRLADDLWWTWNTPASWAELAIPGETLFGRGLAAWLIAVLAAGLAAAAGLSGLVAARAYASVNLFSKLLLLATFLASARYFQDRFDLSTYAGVLLGALFFSCGIEAYFDATFLSEPMRQRLYRLAQLEHQAGTLIAGGALLLLIFG